MSMTYWTAAQPDDGAIGGAPAVALFTGVSLELLVLERLVGEEEHVADVGEDIDHAAGHGRPRLVVCDGAPGAFAPDEQADGKVHDDRCNGCRAEQGTRDIKVGRDKQEEACPGDEIEHGHVKQREYLVGQQHGPMRDLSGEGIFEIGA